MYRQDHQRIFNLKRSVKVLQEEQKINLMMEVRRDGNLVIRKTANADDRGPHNWGS